MATPVAALILSAGNSGRMGREKASLPYGNGLTFAGQLIRTYTESGCRPVIMVVNNGYTQAANDEGKVQYVLNSHVERGRSYSVWLGLQNIPAGLPCFIQNIDNPFAEISLLLQMISNLNPEGYTVPQFEGKGGHPVLLGSRVADHLRKMEEPGNLREVLRDFYRTEIQTPDGRILWNINTPEDYLNFINFTNPPGS